MGRIEEVAEYTKAGLNPVLIAGELGIRQSLAAVSVRG